MNLPRRFGNKCVEILEALIYLDCSIYYLDLMYATEDKMYQCSKCNFNSKEDGDLLRHMLSHAQEMEYTCITCGVSFTNSSSKVPTKCQTCLVLTKPYECPDCSYRSSTSGDMKKHVRKHTGERPYTCSLCGSKYKRSSHLKRHMLIHSRHQMQQENASIFNQNLLNLEDKAPKRLGDCDLEASNDAYGLSQADISVLAWDRTNSLSHNIQQKMFSRVYDISENLDNYVSGANKIVAFTNKVQISKKYNNGLDVQKSMNLNECVSQNATSVRDILNPDINKPEKLSTNGKDIFTEVENIDNDESQEKISSAEPGHFTKLVENLKVESEKEDFITDHNRHTTKKNVIVERSSTSNDISRQELESLDNITDENIMNIHSLGIEHFLSVTYSDGEDESGKEQNNSGKDIHNDREPRAFQNTLFKRLNTFMPFCICGKLIENRNASQRQEKCNSCLSVFLQKNFNKIASNVSKIIKCFLCGKVFPSELLLKRHMREHREYEDGQTVYRCSKCDYKCAQAILLKRHYMTHTGEKPFECTDCGYKCATNGDLKKHMPTHTGERPFGCSVCDYKCKRSSHLKRHMLRHSHERKFTCSVCDFSCKRKDHLLKHLEKHTPHTVIHFRKDSIQNHYLENSFLSGTVIEEFDPK